MVIIWGIFELALADALGFILTLAGASEAKFTPGPVGLGLCCHHLPGTALHF